MLYATDGNGNKIRPSKGLIAVCSGCGSVMVPKCGKIKIWHWAHETNQECDAWSDGETEWHLGWKQNFPKESVEVHIDRDGVKHYADVLTPKGVVIELQHSPISPDVIKEREQFYGNMIWVFDLRVQHEHKRLQIYLRSTADGAARFMWFRPKKSFEYITKEMYWDFGSDKLFKPNSTLYEGGHGQLIRKNDFIEAHNAHNESPKAYQSALF